MGKQRSSNAEKSRRYRERMRAEGLRPVQIWVPDIRNPAFIEECKREMRIIAANEGELDFYDEDDIEGWTA
ncbi:MAG: antitoxin MazE family protein [Nitrococcus sp.]|nr:antitoxin MazE family protein [Nitrococcus sp.]